MALRIALKRAYDPPAPGDGPRVLVDRVWPRGVSKQRLRIVAWLRDIAPSTALRRWFGHDPGKWEEFRRRYRAELAAKPSLLDELAGYARGGRLTLVFGARDPVHNQAAVIKDALQARRVGGSVPKASSRRPGSKRPPPWPARRARVRSG
jgi:uncharacterized protein YeaO (DUF488 family)